MTTVASSGPVDKTTVSYARLYDALEGYAMPTPAGLVFVEHDGHVYALTPDQAQAVCTLGAVPAVERAYVLAALAQCAEMA